MLPITRKFLEQIENCFTDLCEQLGIAWWVKVVTDNPGCTYYFGPFASAKEAKLYQPGYIEDLVQEEAQIIAVDVKRCAPKRLTSFEEEVPESI